MIRKILQGFDLVRKSGGDEGGKRQMRVVAGLVARVLNGEAPEKVKKDVVEFKNNYQEVEYCFSHELGAYEFPAW